MNAASAYLTTLGNLCVTFMKIGKVDIAVRGVGKAMMLANSTGREALAQEIAGKIEERVKRRRTPDMGRKPERQNNYLLLTFGTS